MDILVIEAGSGDVRAVRFGHVGKGLLFREGGTRRPVDPGDPVSGLVGLPGSGEREETVLLSLDPAAVFCREVELPIADRRKLRQVLPLELKGGTAIDTEELLFDALPLGDGRVLAVWTVAADLSARIGDMTAAGLEPRFAGCHPYHWDLLLPDAVTGPVALCDGRSLAVFDRGFPLLCRSLDRDEPLADLDRTLAMLELASGKAVDRVFLHGDAAGDDRLRPPEDQPGGRTFARLPVNAALAAAFPDVATAVRLAGLWSFAEASLRGEPVNFRHGQLTFRAGKERFRKRLRPVFILAALLVVLLAGETGLRYYFVSHDLSSLDASIRAIYREVFPDRKKAADEVADVKAEIRRLGGGDAGPGVLRVLNDIALVKGNDISGLYEVEIDGDQVRLKGEARSIRAVTEFKGRLEPLFASSETGEVKTRPDGSVSFALRGVLREVAR